MLIIRNFNYFINELSKKYRIYYWLPYYVCDPKWSLNHELKMFLEEKSVSCHIVLISYMLVSVNAIFLWIELPATELGLGSLYMLVNVSAIFFLALPATELALGSLIGVLLILHCVTIQWKRSHLNTELRHVRYYSFFFFFPFSFKLW